VVGVPVVVGVACGSWCAVVAGGPVMAGGPVGGWWCGLQVVA